MRAEAADFLNDRTTPIKVGDILVPRAYAVYGYAFEVTTLYSERVRHEKALQHGMAVYVGPKPSGRIVYWNRYFHYCAVDDCEADQFTPEEYAIYRLSRENNAT